MEDSDRDFAFSLREEGFGAGGMCVRMRQSGRGQNIQDLWKRKGRGRALEAELTKDGDSGSEREVRIYNMRKVGSCQKGVIS